MVDIELVVNEKANEFTLPEKWNELSLKQLLYISNLWQSWAMMMKADMTFFKAKALLFLEMLNGNTIFNRNGRKKLITSLAPEDQTDLVGLVDFVFKDNTLTACPLPMVRVGFKNYYAPGDGLVDITASEFHFADRFFMAYTKDETDENLNNFIACIYRKAVAKSDKSGKKREAFNHLLIEENSNKLARLPYAEKQLMLLWYIGCRKALVAANADLFQQGDGNDTSNKGWLPLIMALSGDKFGTFEQTGATDFQLILMELREMKARQPKEKGQ